MRSLLLTCLLWGAVASSDAQPVYEPQRGTAEREAILDAVRASVMALSPAIASEGVEFVVWDLNVQGGDAFVSAFPISPGTTYSDERDPLEVEHAGVRAHCTRLWDNDAPDVGAWALLRRERGLWTVVELVTCATDVFWAGWPEQHGVSGALVGMPGMD